MGATMKVDFLLTIDCDMRISSVVTRGQSLRALHEAFESEGVAGHVTWFVNENDFAFAHSHEEFLQTVVKAGDTIGVHDHIDFLNGRWEYEPVRDFCAKSRVAVQQWLSENDYAFPLRCHRFGCAVQHPAAYEAILDLGYSISSDVVPGTIHNTHTQKLAFDNRSIPLGIPPYHHGADEIGAYRSKTGPMLQIPFARATLSAAPPGVVYPEEDYPRWPWPRFSRAVADRWIEGAKRLGNEMCVIVLAFHPYEIVDKARLRVEKKNVDWLREIIGIMREEYGAAVLNMEECAAQFE